MYSINDGYNLVANVKMIMTYYKITKIVTHISHTFFNYKNMHKISNWNASIN